MKATQLVCTVILTLLIVGCRFGSSDRSTPDVLLRGFWASASADDFVIPVRTPFDDDPEARQRYLQGYEAGIREGISAMRSNKWHTGDVIHTSSGSASEAFARGWRDAASALLKKEAQFIDEINQERPLR